MVQNVLHPASVWRSLVLFVLMISPLYAADFDVHVQQIETSRQPLQQRQIASAELPFDREMTAVAAISETYLNLRHPTGNVTIIDQLGLSNDAQAVVFGLGNYAQQNQRGALNSSDVDIRGSLNTVLVDQDGLRLRSEINVTDGSHKTILHIQRGRGTAAISDSIDLSGHSAEKLIVLDTPRGRMVLER